MLFVCFMHPDIMCQGCCLKQEARICQSDVLRQSQGFQPIERQKFSGPSMTIFPSRTALLTPR